MNNRSKVVSRYNLLVIFLSIIWTPLQLYVFNFDAGGRIVLYLSLFAIAVNFSYLQKYGKVLYSGAFICWTCLVVYAIINTVIKGHPASVDSLFFIRVHFFSPYVLLLLSIIECERNQTVFLKVVLTAFVGYLILGALNFVDSKNSERLIAEGLGNQLPLFGVGTVFVASLLYNGKNIKWWLYYTIVALELYIIMAAATRKALGALVVILVGMVLTRDNNFNFRKIVSVAVLGVGLYIGFNYMMENTLIGERFAQKDEKYEAPLVQNQKVNDFFMTVLGDRAIQYYDCIYNIIPSSPITGIGIGNYATLPQARLHLSIHSEYMTQLCENGWVGFILLILFYSILGLKLIQNRNLNRTEFAGLAAFGLLAIMFIDLTAWTYNVAYVMIMYSIIICQTYCSKTHKNENRNMYARA